MACFQFEHQITHVLSGNVEHPLPPGEVQQVLWQHHAG
jgi:hypothetical protein